MTATVSPSTTRAPRHEALLRPYRLANRLVRNAEWLGFIEDGGYRTPTLWMSDGWAAVQAGKAGARRSIGARTMTGGSKFGPGGLAPLDPEAPVRHVSWYEADAFARWAGARLPTEAELEAAPGAPTSHETTAHVWQWTGSAYLPYPGFRPRGGRDRRIQRQVHDQPDGAARRQRWRRRRAMRGRATAISSIPDKRWQFTGLRLCQDAA